jgi:prepilin-type N-terminal cleavage/methylation domain-containing protein
MRGHSTKAFTLIEFMISIALLAILLSISVHSLFQFRGIYRDRSFSETLEQAPLQMAALRAGKFQDFPPQIAVVGDGGQVQLAQDHLVEGTLRAWSPDGSKEIEVLSHSNQDGTLTLKSASPGSKVLVDYAFHLPHRNESCFLDSQNSCTLSHQPVQKVRFVGLAQGAELSATSDYRIDDNGKLTVPGGQVGQLVVVDYQGGDRGVTVRGKFLDSDLKPSDKPTETKLLEVGEAYNGVFRASFPLLKVRDE